MLLLCLCHLFFDGCVDIGEVALTHHTEGPHLLPQGHQVILIQNTEFRLQSELFLNITLTLFKTVRYKDNEFCFRRPHLPGTALR